jgi:hypothetical protein
VVGPASATDNDLARFDTTTGKLLKAGFSYDTDGTLAANSNTRVATQAAIVTYVAARIAALVDSSPGTLDTLNELAAALADDPNFAATMTTALAGKQPLDSDLTTIAGLTATNDSFLQAKSSAWAARTIAQVLVDLQGDGLTTAMAGYRGLPQTSFSANVTIAAAHHGTDFYHPASDANARTITIDSNTNLALPIGFTFSGYNDTSQAVSIAITTDTLVLVGAGTTGTRTVAQYGSWVCRKVTSTRWVISGAGIT